MSTKLVVFYLVSLPGLEDLVAAELKDWCPDLEFSQDHGGISLKAPLEVGLSLNQVLKTPTRILLRITSFRCRDFPALYKTIATFPWRHWIDPTCDLKANATVRESRLKITKRVEETAEKAWTAYQKQGPHLRDSKKPIELYIRIVKDECTLSLDTSGESLHKRGERQHVGKAPLRETIAGALVQWMGRAGGESSGPIELIDPMMGTGVFLLEAARRDERIESREFQFDIFKGGKSTPLELQTPRAKINHLVGCEIDQKTFKAAEHNLARVSNKTLLQQDIFQSKSLVKSEATRWLICNPPYGERIKIKGNIIEYYQNLFAVCEQVAAPDLACFLIPAKHLKGKLRLPPGWKIIGKRPFLNGGLSIVALLVKAESKRDGAI